MKVTKVSIVLSSLFVCLLALGSQAEERRVGVKVTIQDGVLEEVEKIRPQDVSVYEIRPGDPSLWMKRLTGILGVKGRVRETEQLLSLKEGDRYLEVRKASSTAFYGDMARLWKEKPTPEKTQFSVPGNEENRWLENR